MTTTNSDGVLTRAVVGLTADLAAAELRIRSAIRDAVASSGPSHNTSDGKDAAP